MKSYRLTILEDNYLKSGVGRAILPLKLVEEYFFASS